jgi:hypothetical protein
MGRENISRSRKNSWSPAEAAEWANIPVRTLYRLLREGAVPSLPMGDAQTQAFPNARNGERKRSCFRYVIPRRAFITWWETLGKPKPRSIENTTA